MDASSKKTRLGQWDGPRRSSRSPASLLASLRDGSVWRRLGLVFTCALLVTAIAFWWGLPLPYRIGEVWGHNVLARVTFEVDDPDKTEDAQDEAVRRLTPQQQADRELCEQVRRAVPPVMQHYEQNTVLVRRGEKITESLRHILRAEQKAYLKSLNFRERARRLLALGLTTTMLAILVVLYVVRFQPVLASSTRQIFNVSVLVLLTHLGYLILARPPLHGGLLPLTVTAIILAIAYRPQFALLMTFSLSLAITSTRGTGIDHLLVQVTGQAAAVLMMRNIRTRTQLVEIGAIAGLGFAVMTLATALLTNQGWPMIASDALRRFLWGLLAGFLVSGLLPLIERWFGVVTDVSLMELADGSHPLLQEMVRRAPGTYNHSLTVANLAEHAAEAIGANPLLTRVGAYFHDVGKMLKPGYFIENQNGQNLHDTLEPGLSTLIIIGHVKDGVALAQQYNLPEPVVDFIRQHHGTTLVEYFYRAALRQAEENGHATSRQEGTPCPLESSFRYPGPKPRNRENGIVMLADAVESASRALSDPTPGSLRKLVRDLLMKRLLDGQFEESGLTLSELHQVEEALCKGLIALYHSRIKYPEPAQRRSA